VQETSVQVYFFSIKRFLFPYFHSLLLILHWFSLSVLGSDKCFVKACFRLIKVFFCSALVLECIALLNGAFQKLMLLP
jgi:hypothetical protein